MIRHLTLTNVQPQSTQRSQSRLMSACAAASAVAFLLCAVIATSANAQPPGFPAQQQPGVPQMPGPGGRPPQPNAAADQAPGTATLRGHVFDAATGQALRKAQVRIMQMFDAPQGPAAF